MGPATSRAIGLVLSCCQVWIDAAHVSQGRLEAMHVSLRICHLSDEDPNARLKQYLVRSSWHAVLRSNFACHMQHFPQKTSLAPVSRRCLFGSPRSCPPLFRHCNIEHVCQLAIPCETFNAHDRTVQFQQSGEGQHHWWARMSDLVRLWVHGPS